MDALQSRRRKELRAVLRAGRLSRSQLVEQTGLRKNTVLADVAELVEQGVLREVGEAVPSGGRPRTPLEIDAETRHVVGLSIQFGAVQARRVSLLGEAAGAVTTAEAKGSARLASAAKVLLREQLDARTLAVGVTAQGILDRRTHALRFSAAVPQSRPLSLRGLVALAGDRPVVLENDVHARAARWLALRRPPQRRDTLFVAMDDGRLGATLLIDGRPNRGSVGGANELGHNRLPVQTPPCYCGHAGCLERIFSTPFLQQHAPGSATLAKRIARCGTADDAGLKQVVDLLAYGIANAVNLLRVETLVLAVRIMPNEAFLAQLESAIRRYTLPELGRRLHVEPYPEPTLEPADAAAQVALARLFYDGW